MRNGYDCCCISLERDYGDLGQIEQALVETELTSVEAEF